jgi:predicted nucleic acid-binding protein
LSQRVPFANRPRPLPPRRCNVACDSNALDRGNNARNELVERFETMSTANELIVVVAGGVRREVQHPNTPDEIKAAVLPQIFNLRPVPIAEQQVARRHVATILQGNAQPDTHAADASHLSEAAETGCSYFITHDNRMLRKRDELRAALPPTLQIVTLEEFFEILDDYDEGRRL